MMKQFLKLGLILAAFAVTACVGLAFVYSATADQIAANQGKQLSESLKGLFPAAEEFKAVDDLPSLAGDVKLASAYAIMSGGQVEGIAIQASGQSYGGAASLLVGIGTDKKITGVRVLSSSDTPGLGLNATNPNYYVNKAKKLTFPGQFAGKSISDPFVVKEDVDAITASTITSKALTAIVKACAGSGQAWLDGKAIGGSK